VTDDMHSQAYLYAVGALDPEEAREFEAHLTSCADCRKEVADMSEITARLSEAVAAEPSAQLRAAVLQEIASTPQDRADDPTRTTAGAHAQTVSPGRHAGPVAAGDRSSAVVPLRRRARERVAIVLAAAVALAAVGVGGWALNERNQARDDLAAARAFNDQLTSILSAGDAQTVSAHTTNGALAAVVRSQSQGTAMLLASGLPTLPVGKTYQAWTIDNDTPASAGTFESEGDQTAYQLPASAVQTGTVAVTIEPAGGSEQPTAKPIVALGLG
jgi:anti-sigma-K factor RskA